MSWDPALEKTLARTVAGLQRGGFEYALHGGLAVAVHSRPRPTADVDVIVPLRGRTVGELLGCLENEGLAPASPGAATEASFTSVLPMHDPSTGVSVVASLGAHPFELEMLDRAVDVETAIGPVRIVTAADLLVTRLVAGRPQDSEDAEAVLLAHPDLDRRAVLDTAERLAGELDMLEIGHRAHAWLGL